MSAPRQNLATLVDDFERNGNQTAIVSRRGLRQQKVRYAELGRMARSFAAELHERGIEKGDRVMLWGENRPEWVAAFFGCVLRGVLAVPVDPGSSPEFIERVKREVSPKLIFTNDSQIETGAPVPPPVELAPSDPFQIIFTSGTTSEPKGVVHTHRNVLASLAPVEREMRKYLKYERLFHPIRFLHTLPLSHVFGQFMGLWIPPLLAAEVHYDSRLAPGELRSRIRRERISVVACVPRVLELLERHITERIPSLPARADESVGLPVWKRFWRFRDVHGEFGWKFWAFVCGGASLPHPLEQFWGRLGYLVVQGYGMTETTALISLNHPFRAAAGTVGQVLPGREVRLEIDGEVLVRGETISSATWQGGGIRQSDSEWLATGDLAEFDERGNLRFRGRKKEVIVTPAGLNIYPQDLEAALMKQPGFRSVIVIEEPEGTAKAVLIGDGGDPASAVEAANRELADFQQIRSWAVWPEPDFPRTPTGKVLKRELISRLRQITPASEPLALDSLGRVELQAKIEQQYGVTVDDTALQQVKTTADVQALLSQKPVGKPPDHWYPKWPWTPPMRWIRSVFLEVAAMPLVRFLAKPRLSSQVSDFPNEPFLIVGNHVTTYDGPLILYGLPGRIRRNCAVAMSAEMLIDYRRGRGNILGPFAYLLITGLFNVFPLPRLTGFRRSFEHAGEAVDRGFHVMVFPEGHRSDDGKRQIFKEGSGLLWKELGIPAVAVRLDGLGEIKTGHDRWFRSGRIAVTVTRVLPKPSGQSPWELTRMLEAAVFDS